MYGIAIVGGIAGIPGTMGGRPGYDITMKPTLPAVVVGMYVVGILPGVPSYIVEPACTISLGSIDI